MRIDSEDPRIEGLLDCLTPEAKRTLLADARRAVSEQEEYLKEERERDVKAYRESELKATRALADAKRSFDSKATELETRVATAELRLKRIQDRCGPQLWSWLTEPRDTDGEVPFNETPWTVPSDAVRKAFAYPSIYALEPLAATCYLAQLSTEAQDGLQRTRTHLETLARLIKELRGL